VWVLVRGGGWVGLAEIRVNELRPRRANVFGSFFKKNDIR
jgi:hypothetical protein